MSCHEILGRFHSTKEMGILWLFGDDCFLRHVQQHLVSLLERRLRLHTRNPISSSTLMNLEDGQRIHFTADVYLRMDCASFCTPGCSFMDHIVENLPSCFQSPIQYRIVIFRSDKGGICQFDTAFFHATLCILVHWFIRSASELYPLSRVSTRFSDS